MDWIQWIKRLEWPEYHLWRNKSTHLTEVNVWPKSPFYMKEETEDSESDLLT